MNKSMINIQVPADVGSVAGPMTERSNSGELTMRPYEQADIPIIVQEVLANWHELPNYAGLSPSRERIEYLLANNQNNAMFLVLLLCDSRNNPVGGFCAWCSKMMFSFDVFCQDVFFYIKPEHRSLANAMRLIDGYIKWAKDRKAPLILLSQMSGYRGMDSLGKLYERFGFVQTGVTYRYTEK